MTSMVDRVAAQQSFHVGDVEVNRRKSGQPSGGCQSYD